MGGDDCVPVKVGLQLMDDSSLGLAPREQEFQQTYNDLQRSLKGIVNGMHLATQLEHPNSLQSIIRDSTARSVHITRYNLAFKGHKIKSESLKCPWPKRRKVCL